jgi:ribosomal-protein-alanine N-acetyltransferase
VVFWTVADEIQVLHVAVDPNLRRQGLATQLMDHVFHCANEAESRLITLECRQSNGAAIGLYSAAGFERVAVRSSYYAHGKEDAIIMQLNLNREPHAL